MRRLFRWIFKKLIRTWIPLNIASILGIAQAIVKFLKEVLTACVNLLFPIIPSSKFKDTVEALRAFINKLDAVLENIKEALLK